MLASGLRVAQELGWTRMDLPLLLGTVLTENRSRASAIGYAVHVANGVLFALAYAAVFEAVGSAGVLLGLALGAVHADFVGGGLVNVLLPAVHPRMARRGATPRRHRCSSRPGSCSATTAGARPRSRSSCTSRTARSSARSQRGCDGFQNCGQAQNAGRGA